MDLRLLSQAGELFKVPLNTIPVTIPETDERIVGYAGQLVASILRVAGLYAQSEMLDKFHSFFSSAGALIYIFCVIGAIISWALYGRFRESLYLLLGPALYWFVIGTNVPATSTFEFGDRKVELDSKSMLSLFDWPIFNDYGDKVPQVSWVFAEYDRVITSIVQSLVSVLVDTKNREDLIISARERMLTRLYAAQGTDNRFVQLLVKGLMGECGKYAHAQHQLSQFNEGARVLKADYEAQVARLKDHPVQVEPYLQSYFQEIRAYHSSRPASVTSPDSNVQFSVEALGQQLLAKVNLPETAETYTCSQLWTFSTLGAFMIAEGELNKPQQPGSSLQIPWNDVRKQIAATLVHDACFEGSLSADERMEKIRNQNGGTLIDPNTGQIEDPVNLPGLGDIGRDRTEQDRCRSMTLTKMTSKATEVVAAFIIRNTIGSSVFQQMANNANERGSWNPGIYRTSFGNMTTIEREARKGSLYWFAASIPYIQGVLQFMLAMSFPFFAAFLLMPTKAYHFATWLCAWAWVKSWDVGFAALYFIRELLWQYMRGDIRSAYDVDKMNWSDPGLIYTVMFQADPLANLDTYFHIIALMTLSIPLMTAQATLGATSLVGALGESLDLKATQFGARKGRAARRMEASLVGRYIAERNSDYKIKFAEAGMQNLGYNIKGESRAAKLNDPTWVRYSKVLENVAQARFMTNENQYFHRNMLAGVTGRKMSYTAGMSKGVLQAYTYLRNEEFRGSNYGWDSSAIPAFLRDDRYDGGSGLFLGVENIPGATEQFGGDRYNQDSDGQ